MILPEVSKELKPFTYYVYVLIILNQLVSINIYIVPKILNLFTLFSSQDFLKHGIMGNEFLKNLSAVNIRDIVDCMFPVEYKKDTIIIKEGDPGSRVYAIEGTCTSKYCTIAGYT